VATPDRPRHPIDGSYWALETEVLAGPHPGVGSRDQQRAAIKALVAAGIRTIVDLTTPAESTGSSRVLWEKLAADPTDAAWTQHPILDGGVPSIASMQLILDTIDASRRRGRPVYVHCMGGLGRTGTVIGCWWSRHGLFEGDAVFEQLRLRRQGQSNEHRISPETSPQFHMIRTWKRND
jgi:hypothetical protein